MLKTLKALISELPTPLCTPLIHQGAVWLKLEGGQITGSVKYRMVYTKVMAALAAGMIDAHTVLLEVTSGSTGVALAYMGSRLGVRVVLHAYQNACPRKCALIKEYGANLILHSPDIPLPRLLAHVSSQGEQQGYWHLNQYSRPAHIEAYHMLGQEIVQQFEMLGAPTPKIFACPVGTGGLIQGVGTYLRQVWPRLKIVAVEPASHVSIPGMRNTQVWHMGQEDPYDTGFPDIRVTVLAPENHTQVGGLVLGDSATSVYEMSQQVAWQDVLIIAPD
jgi:cysteine synthase